MLPFGVTIPATVPQGLEIPEGLMNNPVYYIYIYVYTQQYSTIVSNYNFYLVRGDMFRLLMQPKHVTTH